MPQLKSLDLRNWVTDNGLKEMIGLPQLQTLILTGCEGITDAGLKEIGKMTQLKFLYLGLNTGITEVGMKGLVGLKQLEVIEIGAKSPSTVVKELAGLTKLKTPNLMALRVPIDELKEIAKWKNLHVLEYDGLPLDQLKKIFPHLKVGNGTGFYF